jgi:hypothetical protein
VVLAFVNEAQAAIFASIDLRRRKKKRAAGMHARSELWLHALETELCHLADWLHCQSKTGYLYELFSIQPLNP